MVLNSENNFLNLRDLTLYAYDTIQYSILKTKPSIQTAIVLHINISYFQFQSPIKIIK